MIIGAKIDVKKINKDLFFKGEKGLYMDISILENKNGTDQYGNDFMITQDVGKEARARGEKGPIIGNGKYRVRSAATPPPPQEQSSEPRYADEPKADQPEDDLGF